MTDLHTRTRIHWALTAAITLSATGCGDATGFGLAEGPSVTRPPVMNPPVQPPNGPPMPPPNMMPLPPTMPTLPTEPMVMPPMPPPNLPFDATSLDRQVPPCQDFFGFVCGGWKKTHALTAGQSSVSNFSLANSRVVNDLVRLIDGAIAEGANPGAPADARRMASYNAACLAAPTQPESRMRVKTILATVDGVTTLDHVARVAGELRGLGIPALLVTFLQIDPASPSRYVLTTDHGAIGLLRDAYLQPTYAAVLDAYRMHIQRMGTVLGVPIDGDAVVRVETELARGELTPEQRENQVNLTNRMSFAEAQALAPRFAWRSYLDAVGHGPITAMNVRPPTYLKQLELALGTLSVEDLKHYLRWQVAERLATLLDQPVLDEEFQFHDKLAGREMPNPRRGTCRALVLAAHGDAVARRYVVDKYDERSTTEVRKMLTSLRGVLQRRMTAVPWLDAPTRMEALTKLAAIGEKVGHPETWPGPPMPLEVRNLLEDRLMRSQEDSRGQARALTEMSAVNKGAWALSPITVNAAYVATLNEVQIPAAILQPPFFHVSRNPLANYAAIGSVIAHEFTHAFDTAGRHFDGTGALRPWWSPMVSAEFDRRSQCLVDVFNKHEVVPGKFVNGKLTLGENIADLGGMRLALDAFLQDAANAPMVEGFDARQQFFIGSAQVWCNNMTDTAAANQLLRDDHAPNRARVNVTFAHVPEFAQAFSCPAGSAMVAANRCEIW